MTWRTGQPYRAPLGSRALPLAAALVLTAFAAHARPTHGTIQPLSADGDLDGRDYDPVPVGRTWTYVDNTGAVFALLGTAAALAVYRRPANATVRWLPGVGAALALLAFTGVAPRADLVAHLAGLVLGFGSGLAAVRLGTVNGRHDRWLQRLVGVATGGVLALAWTLALRH